MTGAPSKRARMCGLRGRAATPRCQPGKSTQKGNLVGTLEMPMALGLVGGATKTHPAARAALKILGVESAQELAEVTVAVGLAQNMGALRALATEGIQRGHMALHARNIAIVAGATGDEIDKVAASLAADHDVRVDRARDVLRAHPGREGLKACGRRLTVELRTLPSIDTVAQARRSNWSH